MERLEQLEKQDLIIKLKESQRQLEIKTLALANTKNEYHYYRQKVKKERNEIIKLIKQSLEICNFGETSRNKIAYIEK